MSAASLSRRARRARRILGARGSIGIFVRMLAWAAVLPLLKRRLPLARLVELAVPGRRPPHGPDVHTVATLSSWIYRAPGLRDNCLERSLLTFRYLPRNAPRFSLVLGVLRQGASGPPGHAWLVVGDEPVHDRPESLSRFAPVVAFDATGRRSSTSNAEATPQPQDGQERGP